MLYRSVSVISLFRVCKIDSTSSLCLSRWLKAQPVHPDCRWQQVSPGMWDLAPWSLPLRRCRKGTPAMARTKTKAVKWAEFHPMIVKGRQLSVCTPRIIANLYLKICSCLSCLPAQEEISSWAWGREKGSREGPGTAGDSADGSQPAARGCGCVRAPAARFTQQLPALAAVHGSPSAGHTDRTGPRCGREGPQNHLLQVSEGFLNDVFCLKLCIINYLSGWVKSGGVG